MALISDAAENPGDFARRLAETNRDVAAARTARRAENTAISAKGISLVGGDITVDERGAILIRGGTLILTDADDTTGIAFLGTNAAGLRIWAFSFRDGRTAFRLSGVADNSVWTLQDNNERILMSNDGVSGTGLARPYLQYPLVAGPDAELSGTSAWPSTTATSPGTTVLGIATPIWHPKIRIGAGTTTSGGTGHWRLRLAHGDINEVLVADATGNQVHTVDVPSWGEEILPGDECALTIEAWVTGGGSRVWVQYNRCYGRQS